LLSAQAARNVHSGSAGEGLDAYGVRAGFDDSHDLSGAVLRSPVEGSLLKGRGVLVVLGEAQGDDA